MASSAAVGDEKKTKANANSGVKGVHENSSSEGMAA